MSTGGSKAAPLFELRCYTLKAGATAAFWQAQVDRGFDLVAPIQQRLVGYFSTAADAAAGEQIWHLYRYDGFDDWRQRLHGLYGVAALEPYFATVRALMTAQENRFMQPAPLGALSPLWNDATDWLPGRAELTPMLEGATPDGWVEAQTTVLLPGTQPRWWQAWREAAADDEVLQPDNLLGCFVTLVGRQHQVLTLRRHADADARRRAAQRLQASAQGRRLQQATAGLIVEQQTVLLRPAPLPELAPLFHAAAR